MIRTGGETSSISEGGRMDAAANLSVEGGRILICDIGGTHVKFGMTVFGKPADWTRLFPTRTLMESDPVQALAAMIDSVMAEIGEKPDVLVSTVPGYIDLDHDKVIFAGNISSLNGRALATELSSAIGLPVILERDSVLMLMGEVAAGAGVSGKSVLGIFFGTGVGAAFIQDGKPFRGAGWALEIGSMPFRLEGRQLSGLRKDGLENYVSGRALQLIAERHGVPLPTIFEAARGGANTELSAEIERFVQEQAVAIGIACALLSPDLLVIGGGVCEMAGFPGEGLRAAVAERAPFDQTGRPMNLSWTHLGWRAVLHGAPLIARGRLGREPDDRN